MCLALVDEETDPKAKSKYWYKIVDKTESDPVDTYTTPWYNFRIKLKTWYRNSDIKSHGTLSTTGYPSRKYYNGFHFYDEKCLANLCLRENHILKCKVRTVTATGEDIAGRACVAQEFIAISVVDTYKIRLKNYPF